MENPIPHQSFTIKQLSNKELLSHTKLLVQKERRMHIQVLRHLAEIDSRKLFFKQGFFSLFDYAVRELGYSEGAAYRRIKAMKLCCALPETANRLQSGRLSLSAASQLQVFFEKQDKKIKEEEKKALLLKSAERRVSENEAREQKKSGEEQILIKIPEKKVLKKEETGEHLKIGENFQNEDLNRTLPLSQEEKENLVKKMEGCSTRTTEKLLSEVDPSLSPLTRKEKVRFLGKGKVEVKIVIDEKCHKELEKLKNLLSHKSPNLSYGELISLLSKEALKKHDPGEKNIRQRKEAKVQKNPSVKKPEFKSKSIELAVTSAPKLRQKDEISEHLETSSSGKSVISARKQISPTRKLLTSTNKSDGLATSAPRSEQIDQYSKEKITSASKSGQIDQYSKEKITSASKSGQINQYSKEKATFTLRPKHQIKKISRYIPFHLRKYIWARDQGQCTYVHHETKRRCASRHLLQIDHIQPFALGGRTEKENLRLLCAGHNQYRR